MALSESEVLGKWNVTTILMGSLGEIPAGENDFFQFENGTFTSVSQGEKTEANYTLEDSQIIVIYPHKKEVLTVTKLTKNDMTFFVDVFINGKKMSASNISFKLTRSDNTD